MSENTSPIMSLAQVAFEAYSKATGGKTWDGKDIPPYEALPQHVREAWDAAADAVSQIVVTWGDNSVDEARKAYL